MSGSKSISARVSMDYFYEVCKRADEMKLNVNDYIIFCLANHSNNGTGDNHSTEYISALKREIGVLKRDLATLKKEQSIHMEVICAIADSDLGKKWIEKYHPDIVGVFNDTEEENTARVLNAMRDEPLSLE